ncbi:MAG: FAD-dependent oxidoreductase [Chloroflexi bacterium]|nr:FAD-dependent oxidoreductase [Chloroflexota bacterium]
MITPSHYDLVVAGATPGGIACAVRAAREGLRVLLVSHGTHLGGMFSSGLNVEDTLYLGNRAPLYTEFREGIKRHYRETYGEDSEQYQTCADGRLTFEPKVAEAVLTQMVTAEASLDVLRGYVPIAVERSERLVRSVTIVPLEGEGTATRGETRVAAHVFVDATYEADLAALAGVPYRIGRESRAEFNEQHAGKIFTTHVPGHFPREAHDGRLKLLTFRLTGGEICAGSTGEGDRAVQAFNYRVCLSRDPANAVPPTKPASYRREDFLGLIADHRETVHKPYPLKAQLILDDIEDFRMGRGSTPNAKQSWNQPTIPGGGHGWAEGDWKARAAIARRHWDHAMGLLWFLQNDPEVPAHVREDARRWGLAKDEFADNGHVPYELFVREARRIVGRATFTEHDGTLGSGLERAPIHEDAVAITEWPMDSHECTLERRYGSLYDGKFLLSEATRPGQIPYRCLLPQDVDNVLVPVCLSCTHVGWGTIRLEPVWMHVGEVAGYAAALSLRRGELLGTLSPDRLQWHVANRRVMLSFVNEFDMAADAPWVPAVQYLGTKGFFPSYDARPLDPLDSITAIHWARSACDVLQGQGNAGERARHLLRALRAPVPSPGEPTTVWQFRELLAGELRYRDQDVATLQRRAPVGLTDDAALTRGDACRLVVALIAPHAGT